MKLGRAVPMPSGTWPVSIGLYMNRRGSLLCCASNSQTLVLFCHVLPLSDYSIPDRLMNNAYSIVQNIWSVNTQVVLNYHCAKGACFPPPPQDCVARSMADLVVVCVAPPLFVVQHPSDEGSMRAGQTQSCSSRASHNVSVLAVPCISHLTQLSFGCTFIVCHLHLTGIQERHPLGWICCAGAQTGVSHAQHLLTTRDSIESPCNSSPIIQGR